MGFRLPGGLGIDDSDLYQLHGFDAGTPSDEALQTLDDLVRADQIRKQNLGAVG